MKMHLKMSSGKRRTFCLGLMSRPKCIKPLLKFQSLYSIQYRFDYIHTKALMISWKSTFENIICQTSLILTNIQQIIFQIHFSNKLIHSDLNLISICSCCSKRHHIYNKAFVQVMAWSWSLLNLLPKPMMTLRVHCHIYTSSGPNGLGNRYTGTNGINKLLINYLSINQTNDEKLLDFTSLWFSYVYLCFHLCDCIIKSLYLI